MTCRVGPASLHTFSGMPGSIVYSEDLDMEAHYSEELDKEAHFSEATDKKAGATAHGHKRACNV